MGEQSELKTPKIIFSDWCCWTTGAQRDIQSWEYQPVASHWQEFRDLYLPGGRRWQRWSRVAMQGPPQEPVLTYLTQTGSTTFDVNLEATINGTPVTRTNFRYLYWSLRQQIASSTVNGCPLRPGDLLASGTVSGPTPESRRLFAGVDAAQFGAAHA
jgi:fumarylacetoacetase